MSPHVRLRVVQRGRGDLAVVKAAYIGGRRLYHEREDTVWDFAWRRADGEIVHEGIVGSHGLGWEELANLAEWTEPRWDGVTARELIVALPVELSEKDALALADQIAEHLHARYGAAVLFAVHLKVAEARGGRRELHAHLLMTRRVMGRDGLGERISVFDDTRGGGIPRTHARGPLAVRELRYQVVALMNEALERAGVEARYNPLSYRDQGLARVPMKHLGRVATTLARGGYATHQGAYNDATRWVNDLADFLGGEAYDPYEAIERERTAEAVLQEWRKIGERNRMLRALEREMERGTLTADPASLARVRADRRRGVALRRALRPEVLEKVIRPAMAARKAERALPRTRGRDH